MRAVAACKRVEDFSEQGHDEAAIVGCVERKCVSCGRPCYVSPSTQRLVAAGAWVVCFQCAAEMHHLILAGLSPGAEEDLDAIMKAVKARRAGTQS